MSQANVRALTRRGILEGKKDPKTGRWSYSALQLDRAKQYQEECKRPTKGEREARILKHFRAGASLADIVIDTRCTTRQVLALKKIHDPGVWVLEPDQVLELCSRLERSGFRCSNAEQLIAAVARLCARDAQLSALQLSDVG
jgi:hypothetical protein